MHADRSRSSAPTSSKSGGGCTRAATPPRTTATSASASTRGRLLMTPTSVCKGFMTPDMMCITDLDGRKLAGRARPVVRDADAPRGLPPAARTRRRSSTPIRRSPPAFAVAGIPLDRAVLAEVVTTLGSIPIAEYATPSTMELPEAVRKYVKAHDGMLLANHGALTLGRGSVRRVLQDGDDRALRQDQPGGADARRRAPALARGGERLQGLRGHYGITSPAPICAEPVGPRIQSATARWSRRRSCRRPAAGERLDCRRRRARPAARSVPTRKFG